MLSASDPSLNLHITSPALRLLRVYLLQRLLRSRLPFARDRGDVGWALKTREARASLATECLARCLACVRDLELLLALDCDLTIRRSRLHAARCTCAVRNMGAVPFRRIDHRIACSPRCSLCDRTRFQPFCLQS